MPTFEIISVNCPNTTKLILKQFPFKLLRDFKNFYSHRGLFEDEIAKIKGVIYHLGNPDLKKEPFTFAGNLIEWHDDGYSLHPKYSVDIFKIILFAKNTSPNKEVWVLTDMQVDLYGLEENQTNNIIECNLLDFISLNDNHTLKYNHLYKIT
jgi:hypothetical protein